MKNASYGIITTVYRNGQTVVVNDHTYEVKNMRHLAKAVKNELKRARFYQALGYVCRAVCTDEHGNILHEELVY